MQFISQKTHKFPHISYVSLKGLFMAFLPLCISIFYPMTASAGLFSFFEDISVDKVSAKTVEGVSSQNTQNMALLQAAVNSDPNANASLIEAPIFSGNALVAEIGPAGTVSDVENQISSTQISIYKVRAGDTLSGIAKMFNVSVNTIVWTNELGKNPVIREGQTLVILPISGIKYVVKKGDTIKGVVGRYKADLEEVLQYNDLTLSSVLTVGDTLIIPDAEPTLIETPKILAKKTTQNPVHDANGPYYPGYYTRPIDGGTRSQGLHGYNAVDLAAPIGTPIHAAADGTVIVSLSNGGWNGGYGNYVILSHSNGSFTLYAHTQKNFVKVGDRVEQGQLIAKVGNTGKSTGPHVHFEIRGARNPF